MKLRTLAGICLLAALSGAARGDAVSGDDAVVAVVNKEVITAKDVLERANALLAGARPGLAPDEIEEARKQAVTLTLRQMVDEKLLEAEAKRLADANEAFRKYVQERTERLLEEERIDAGGDAHLRDRIAESGLSWTEYGERIRKQIMRETVMYYFVPRDLTVSPSEILQYYRARAEDFREPEQARYRQIFIEKRRYETREKAAAVAQDVLEQVKKQHDFGELARKYSDDSRAQEGGLWDWTRRGARPAEIEAVLFNLKPGDTGGPVETEIGFTLLKMEEHKPARVAPFEEVQKQIETGLLTRKRAERSDELFRRLEKENLVKYTRGH